MSGIKCPDCNEYYYTGKCKCSLTNKTVFEIFHELQKELAKTPLKTKKCYWTKIHEEENMYDEKQFEEKLDYVLAFFKEKLMEKNKSYGDSALNPIRIFSSADPIEQIKVRIDDKLSRMANGETYIGDNDTHDMTGYLLLLEIAERDARPTAPKNDHLNGGKI